MAMRIIIIIYQLRFCINLLVFLSHIFNGNKGCLYLYIYKHINIQGRLLITQIKWHICKCINKIIIKIRAREWKERRSTHVNQEYWCIVKFSNSLSLSLLETDSKDLHLPHYKEHINWFQQFNDGNYCIDLNYDSCIHAYRKLDIKQQNIY